MIGFGSPVCHVDEMMPFMKAKNFSANTVSNRSIVSTYLIIRGMEEMENSNRMQLKVKLKEGEC
jgi:hypothetical protein